MFTLQAIILYLLLPPAILLLALLIVPTPECIKSPLVRFVQAVFSAHFPGYPAAKFVGLILLAVLGSFVSASVKLVYYNDVGDAQREFMGHTDMHLKAMRWRNERNWWIALYALSAYSFLYLYNVTLRGHFDELRAVRADKEK